MRPRPLPRTASDPAISSWIQEFQHEGMAVLSATGKLALYLDFHRQGINLGEIATGASKATIDGLWPPIGGTAKSPEDHRIAHLVVTRTQAAPSHEGVDVSIRRF